MKGNLVMGSLKIALAFLLLTSLVSANDHVNRDLVDEESPESSLNSQSGEIIDGDSSGSTTSRNTLAIALSGLVEKSNNDLTVEKVRKCVHDPETCARSGPENVQIRGSELYEESCGKTIVMQPFDTVTLNLVPPKDASQCVVNLVIRNYFERKYFFTFTENLVIKFPDCGSTQLTIDQHDKYQIYCNGIFSITEFPSQNQTAKISYKDTRQDAKPLLLTVQAVYDTQMRQQFEEATEHPTYTTVYSGHRSITNDDTPVQTFDPKLTIHQHCPLECGRQQVTYDKVPRADLLAVKDAVPNPVDEQDFPWYVTVEVSYKPQLKRPKKTFGGSVVNSRTILTAANYLAMERPAIEKILVKTRPFITDDSARLFGQIVPVEKEVIHPDFSIRNATFLHQLYQNDLALLILREPLRLGFTVSPVCSAPPIDYWGNIVQTLRPVHHDGKDYLTEAFSIIWKGNLCQKHVELNDEYRAFCHSYHDAVPREENIGSPVMINMRNVWFQVGVLSQYFTDPYYPSGTILRISTKIFFYRDFIRKNSYGYNDPNYSNYCY